MTFRTRIIVSFSLLLLLAAGLFWGTYRSAKEIDASFTTFIAGDLYTLHHLFSLRANLSEHERLLYEYYATQSRTTILIRLALLRRTLDQELAGLSQDLADNAGFFVLEQAYAGYAEEADRLDAILQQSKVDWDAARASLVRLSDHGLKAGPALDQLFQLVSDRSDQTQQQVKSRLLDLTRLVAGFVLIMLVAALAMAYASREALRVESERRRLAFFPERSPNPTCSLTLDGELIYANPASHRLAARINEDLQTVLPADIQRQIHALRDSGEQTTCYEYRLHDHILQARLLLLKDLGHCHVYISDVTRERRAEEELRYTAFQDAITGLRNRNSFTLDCERWADGDEKTFSVLTIGFLRFELVARSVGQNIIDELLKQISLQIQHVVDGESGYTDGEIRLYRLYGANYALLLRGQSGRVLRELTGDTARKILDMLSAPMHIRRREFSLQPVIGASFCPDDGVTATDLIGGASVAQGCLIAQHQSGYMALTAETRNAEQSWLDTESALRRGLENDEFCLYYQPKVVAGSHRPGGVEALVRWNRPGAGLVLPGNFIPVAEESGLIILLGAWILDAACAQAKSWETQGYPAISVAVNVSRLQFQQSDFVDQVAQALRKYELDPACLELEITESMLMEDTRRNIATLEALRTLGVDLALDDFGTGYSSLQYLRQFPVTRLKIDRSFVISLDENPRACAVVQSMIDLAHNLGLKVIAEGVETEAQLITLTRLGCDEYQGYYFSRPLPTEAVTAWWDERQYTVVVPVHAHV